ncbi:MAG: DUF4019 domain-containing protein [Rhodothermales bacterium]|nr:DUF4019 domain-containing protein [Rhodothermales bacterium]
MATEFSRSTLAKHSNTFRSRHRVTTAAADSAYKGPSYQERDRWSELATADRGRHLAEPARTLNSVELEDALQGMPEGNYAFVFFDTTLENSGTASEMVGLMLEDDSTWRVIGYQTL